MVGDRVVIALLPADEGQPREDLLAGIADKARKDLGGEPTRLDVFEYSIDWLRGSAELKRLPTVTGREIYDEQAGYVEREIGSADDLRAFLESADDVVDVRSENGVLIVGGRRLKGRLPRAIEVEDVAALWQSDLAAERTGISGSGFSLDPTFDYSKVAVVFGRAFPEIRQRYPAAVSDDDLTRVLEDLSRHEDDEFIDFLNRIPDRSFSQAFLQWLGACCQFQQARYDGELRGTEIGMTLFYTDLVAKLWALDYEATMPQAIEGFLPSAGLVLPAMYREELAKYPSTRVWFGPREDAYQRVRSGATERLLFQRNATRVYSASSDPLEPGKEVTANAAHGRFLDWWNDHYEEVARFEPDTSG